MIKNKILMGAHVSISGGVENSISRAENIKSSCAQIFVKNNRQWTPPKISQDSIKKFKENLKKSKIENIYAHATYLINLASENLTTRERSKETLEKELLTCSSLNIPALVLHPGSCGKQKKEDAIHLIAESINEILSDNKITTTLLLETMAGQGSSIGSTFEELKEIYQLIENKDKVGFCVDTCHIFASGYDISNKMAYEKTISNFNNLIGIDKIKMFHINDSKKELGSKVDRHEHIGQGKIGINAFNYIMNDERFFNIPKILETPKNSDEEDIINLNKLLKTLKDRSLIKQSLLEEIL